MPITYQTGYNPRQVLDDIRRKYNRPALQEPQLLPSPTDVGWDIWDTARGTGRWAGNKFMGFLDWLNGFSRIGVQTVGAIDQLMDEGEWDPDYNWWRYEDTSDPHRALENSWLTGALSGVALGSMGGPIGAVIGGGIGLGLGLWASLGIDEIPDTPEQAAEALREQAARSSNPMAKALPWLAGLWNEQTIAETFSDPLNFIEAGLGPVSKFMRGTALAAGVRSATSAVIKRAVQLPVIAPLARWADKVAIGRIPRAVGRAAREGAAPSAWQFANMGKDVVAQQRAILDAAGAERYLEMNQFLTHIQEELPGGLRIADDVAEEAMSRVLNNTPDKFPLAYTVGFTQGGRERYDWALRMAQQHFPDIPEIHDTIAAFITKNIDTYAATQALENLKGLPTSYLVDNQYVYHLSTKDFLTALGKGKVSDKAPIFKNLLGGELTSTLHTRDIRKSIKEINQLAADGRMEIVNGTVRFLDEGEQATGTLFTKKVFSDDPAQILMARVARGQNAMNSVDFFEKSALTWGDVADGKTIKQMLLPDEWTRTFGRFERAVQQADAIPPTVAAPPPAGRGGISLDDITEVGGTAGIDATRRILDIASNTKFDKETGQAILRHFQAMRNIEANPGPILRFFERYRRVWGALTLTPFAPYHSRNTIGGVIVNEMEFGPGSILAGIKAMFKNDEIDDAMARAGIFKSTQTSEVFHGAADLATIAPLSNTPLKSFYNQIAYWTMPLERGPKGLQGRTNYWGADLMGAIEKHQRKTAVIASLSRGETMEQALKTSVKLHFDYADIPPWLQKYRGLTAFPTWSIKMLPLQMEMLYRRPTRFAMRGRFAQHSMEAAGITGGGIPTFIGEGAGFAIPTTDENQPMFFKPENFDPVTVLNEFSDPLRWAYDMLNPLVTEPIAQFASARQIGGQGQPSEFIPAVPGERGAEAVGWDKFFQRPIVRDYVTFNEAIPGMEDQPVPAWLQRADHVAKSFLRVYTELSGTLKMFQQQGISPESAVEVGARRGLGVPMYWQNYQQALHFNLRETEKDLNAELMRSDQNTARLKDILTRRLAILSHSTFAQRDPFTGDLRHWANYGNEETGFVVAGKRQMWQSGIESIWLLLNGSTGPLTQPLIAPRIPLDQTEQDYLEGLLERLLDTYTIELGNSSVLEEEVDYQSGLGYVESHSMEALNGTNP